jgi:hypothetical protein
MKDYSTETDVHVHEACTVLTKNVYHCRADQSNVYHCRADQSNVYYCRADQSNVHYSIITELTNQMSIIAELICQMSIITELIYQMSIIAELIYQMSIIAELIYQRLTWWGWIHHTTLQCNDFLRHELHQHVLVVRPHWTPATILKQNQHINSETLGLIIINSNTRVILCTIFIII